MFRLETQPATWKGVGVDWPTRIAAAKAALTIPSGLEPDEAKTVTLIVHRTAEGEEVVTVEEEECPAEAPEYRPYITDVEP